MRQSMRVMALVLGSASSVSIAEAQIPGMPLFTNPRYGTGFRLHADYGRPTETDTLVGDLTVIQGGITFALGPVGLGVNVGALKSNAEDLQACVNNPTLECEDQKVTGSALAQLRVAGGGNTSLSLSLFGGISTDINAYDAVQCSTFPDPQACQDYVDARNLKVLTIPVGVAVGLKVPLGFASLNLWGAPRMNLTRFSNCPSTGCPDNASNFRWAAGADLPIFRILSVRAAFESGKNPLTDETESVFGVGASIGIGGMR